MSPPRKAPQPVPPAAPAPAPRQSNRMAGRLIGFLVLALALGGMTWVARVAAANYQFTQARALADRAETPPQIALSIEQLKRLLELDPSNSEIRNRYASLLARKRDFEGAIHELNTARRTGNAQNGLFLIADMYEKLEEMDKAEQFMADTLLRNPNNAIFRDAYLRLLNSRYLRYKALQAKNQPLDRAALEQIRAQFAREARAWAVRAPHDANSYLFLAQYYIEPLYPLQAYRCYLLGLSGAPSMMLNPELMIAPSQAMGTIRQIMAGFAKPYRNLP